MSQEIDGVWHLENVNGPLAKVYSDGTISYADDPEKLCEVATRREHVATLAAEAAVAYVYQCLFHRHRGLIHCDDKFIVFSNRRPESDRLNRKEIALVRDVLRKDKVPPDGFATNGNSWAMVILDYERIIDLAFVEAKLWECWTQLCEDDDVGE